jgi:hypothetical protein
MTADEIETLFHECVKRGDATGVETSIRLMIGVDMPRGIKLYDDLKLALDLAKAMGDAQ